MSFSNITGSIKTREVANDEFYTPNSLAKKLIEEVPIKAEDSILDPFYGLGAFFNNYPENEFNEWYELNLGSDFFKKNERFDWIISNPPFSNLTKTIEHTLNVVKLGFAYIIPTYSLTAHRLDLINRMGFYLSKFIIFENPKSWGIGFQMCFVIFTKQKSDCIKLLKEDNTIQGRLF
tara:strand:- start:360 stop:890 length:531 start_codon:yes stop_codon:yes gene_type:complete